MDDRNSDVALSVPRDQLSPLGELFFLRLPAAAATRPEKAKRDIGQHRKAREQVVKHLPQPMQPMGYAEDGVIRFKPNEIVVRLLEDSQERGRIDMNTIRNWAAQGAVSEDDLVQFVQLIGYSVSGIGDLDYFPHHKLVDIDREADKVWRSRHGGKNDG